MSKALPLVLVVEDESLVRLGAVDLFEELGYAVLEAGNADEAIALLDRHPDIALVFTDVDMPGSMDGIRLAHAVRNRWPPVRLIVTSGLLPQTVTAALPAGVPFLRKPYLRAHVVSSLSRL